VAERLIFIGKANDSEAQSASAAGRVASVVWRAAQYLGGSDVAFEVPDLGAFPGRNTTPDKAARSFFVRCECVGRGRRSLRHRERCASEALALVRPLNFARLLSQANGPSIVSTSPAEEDEKDSREVWQHVRFRGYGRWRLPKGRPPRVWIGV
jgi:hypothetical protein